MQSVKIKTSMVFDLVFAKDTILSCFFFFFLIICLYLLFPAIITQIYNPTIELLMPIGISDNDVKAIAFVLVTNQIVMF